MGKQHREVVTRLDVTQHEERDEDDPQTHQDRKPDTVLTRLERNMATSNSELNISINNNNVTQFGVFLFPTDGVSTGVQHMREQRLLWVHVCR